MNCCVIFQVQSLKRTSEGFEVWLESFASNRRAGELETFTPQSSVDFCLHLLVNGNIHGSESLTVMDDQSRANHYHRCKTETFPCFWTGLAVDFYSSGLPSQASPDRIIFDENGTVLLYSHPNQITVRSSLFANRFFNDCDDRKALLDKLTTFHLASNGLLDFSPAFSNADKLLDKFLSTPVEGRKKLCHYGGDISNIDVSQVFANMNNPNRNLAVKKKKDAKCDLMSVGELEQLIRAFGAICMVSGLPESIILLSVDKVVQSGRYNWTDVLLMSSRINDGKWVRSGGIFDSKEALLAYTETQEDLQGLDIHRATVKIMRKFYVGLITTHFNKYFCKSDK
jgi:hypothetical protein